MGRERLLVIWAVICRDGLALKCGIQLPHCLTHSIYNLRHRSDLLFHCSNFLTQSNGVVHQ